MSKQIPSLILIGSGLDAFVKLSLIMILVGIRKFHNDKRFWISTVLLSIYVTFSYMITDNSVRTILLFIFTLLCGFYILKFNKKLLSKLFIVTFLVWVTMALVDAFYMIMMEIILKLNMQLFREDACFVFLINSLLLFTVVIIFNSKLSRNIVTKISDIKVSTNNKYIIFVIVISVIMFSVIFYFCHFIYNPTIILIVSFLMVLIYTIIVIITIKEYNQKNKIQAQYEILLTNLSEYENLLDIQRVSNHENKNQLLVIKGMINKSDESVCEYIDSIIETQYTDNEILIMKTNRIPSGGLRGLIYYKMLTMKDNKIEVSLDVDKNLKELNFSLIPIKTNQELCKIIGVFLDNAIQAVKEIKDKRVNIVLNYINDELVIKISNSYQGIIDVDKFENKGYTTKGKGHGYGLVLVKNIIKNNNRFVNEKEFNGKLFTQIIKLRV